MQRESTAATAQIHVCPLCQELADYSDDYGWSLCCDHPPYERVEPVEVQGRLVDGAWVFPLPDPEAWKATTGVTILAEQEERDRKRAEWLALSCDERVEARRQQREAFPAAFTMGEIMRDQLSSSVSRMLHGEEQKTITLICPKCREPGCENTRTEQNPRYDPNAKPFSWAGGFSVQMESGVEQSGQQK